jgi:hypothetical protein
VLGSWEFKFKDYEFKAYDLFGLCYYYKGNIKKAIFFHDKMSNGDLETDRALVKQYGM